MVSKVIFMKKIDLKTSVLYVINYAVVLSIVIFTILNTQGIGYYFFLDCLAVSLVLFVVDTILIKSWYHFLLCTLPFSFVAITAAVVLLILGSNINEAVLKISSMEVGISFFILHFYASTVFSWSTAVSILKYKFYAEKQSSKRFLGYFSVFLGFALIAFVPLLLGYYNSVSLSVMPLTVGILLNLIFILKPVRKNNQQE